jgi:hypothetical protein
MILVVSYSKTAILRSKALKSVKALVKLNPKNLLDEQVTRAIYLRLNDSSAITRESAIDLVG